MSRIDSIILAGDIGGNNTRSEYVREFANRLFKCTLAPLIDATTLLKDQS